MSWHVNSQRARFHQKKLFLPPAACRLTRYTDAGNNSGIHAMREDLFDKVESLKERTVNLQVSL